MIAITTSNSIKVNAGDSTERQPGRPADARGGIIVPAIETDRCFISKLENKLPVRLLSLSRGPSKTIAVGNFHRITGGRVRHFLWAMTKKNIILTSIAVLGFATYVYYFTDWFTTPRIQIIVQNRITPALRNNPSVYPISFTLDGRYKLTSVTVVSVSALATNKHPLPLWHLVTKTNSVPTPGFFYGMAIRGMKSAIPNTRPLPLEPNTTYRLTVEAGRARGGVDFRPRAAAQQAN
jgi:hypothetical protein